MASLWERRALHLKQGFLSFFPLCVEEMPFLVRRASLFLLVSLCPELLVIIWRMPLVSISWVHAVSTTVSSTRTSCASIISKGGVYVFTSHTCENTPSFKSPYSLSLWKGWFLTTAACHDFSRGMYPWRCDLTVCKDCGGVGQWGHARSKCWGLWRGAWRWHRQSGTEGKFILGSPVDLKPWRAEVGLKLVSH